MIHPRCLHSEMLTATACLCLALSAIAKSVEAQGRQLPCALGALDLVLAPPFCG